MEKLNNSYPYSRELKQYQIFAGTFSETIHQREHLFTATTAQLASVDCLGPSRHLIWSQIIVEKNCDA